MPERYIRTLEGQRVLDAPDKTAHRAVHRKRLPWVALMKWPAMAKLSFREPGSRMQYAGALVYGVDTAEVSALGLNLDSVDWATDLDLSRLMESLMLKPMPGGDPWLVLCHVPWRPGGVFGNVVEEQIDCVVQLETGRTMYLAKPYPGAYERVAVLCRADALDSVWAVQWLGHSTWTLPGGHMDDGDTIESCAVRELYEETGIRGHVTKILGAFYTPRASTVVVQMVADEFTDRRPDPVEIAAADSKRLDELTPTDRVFCKRAWHLAAGLTEAWVREVGATFDPTKHPRDEAGRFSVTGTGRASPEEVKLRNPSTDEDVTDKTMALLPEEARTQDGARELFTKRLLDLDRKGELEFYHEAPGDVSASMKRKGIKGEYGVFAAVNEPSGFVYSPVKTIVKFRIPRAELENVSPDMEYGGLTKLSDDQVFHLKHPDPKMAGAYISYNDEIPPAWIKDISVVRKEPKPTGFAQDDPERLHLKADVERHLVKHPDATVADLQHAGFDAYSRDKLQQALDDTRKAHAPQGIKTGRAGLDRRAAALGVTITQNGDEFEMLAPKGKRFKRTETRSHPYAYGEDQPHRTRGAAIKQMLQDIRGGLEPEL